MQTRYLRPTQSICVDRRRPKWPCRNGSLSSSTRTRARLGGRIDRCNSIGSRFPSAAATGVSTQIEPPACTRSHEVEAASRAPCRICRMRSAPSCGATEPSRSRSTLNVGSLLRGKTGSHARRMSAIRQTCRSGWLRSVGRAIGRACVDVVRGGARATLAWLALHTGRVLT